MGHLYGAAPPGDFREIDVRKWDGQQLARQPEIAGGEGPVLPLPGEAFQLQIIVSGLKAIAAQRR